MAVPADDKILEIASVALDELEAFTETKLVGDRIAMAKYHARKAYEWMTEMLGGYDPSTQAPQAAEQAVISYVKIRLAGQDPITSPAFDRASKLWRRKAAATFNRELIDTQRAAEEDATT